MPGAQCATRLIDHPLGAVLEDAPEEVANGEHHPEVQAIDGPQPVNRPGR